MVRRTRVRRGAAATGLGSVLSLLMAGPALAQENKGTADPDEIIVTATRRSESIRNVPFNIQAITSDTLEKIGATSIADFARTIPGLSVQDDTPGASRIVMRGLRTGSEAGLAPTTSTYIDEIPIDMPFRGRPLDMTLFDVERVEVLRGPQGTLFGGGAIGGTLRYISRKPSPSAFEARVSSQLSATEHGGFNYNVTGMVNVPVTDRVAVRVNVGQFDNDGYIDNVHSGKKNVNVDRTNSARVAVLFKPTDNLDIDLSYQRQDFRYNESNSLWESQPRYTINDAIPGNTRYRAQLTNLTATYHFGWAKLTSSTSYIDERLGSLADATFFLRDQMYGSFLPPDQLPPFLAYSTRDAGSRSVTQEIRLVSESDGPLDWIVGGYYRTERAAEHYGEGVPLNFVGQGAFERDVIGGLLRDEKEYAYENRVRKRELAAFGELNYKITDAWRASAGIRYYDSRGNGNFYAIDQWLGRNARDANGIARTTPYPDELSTGKYKEQGSVWRFNTSYNFDKNALLYVTVAQGFRPGGFNLVAPNTGIPPEGRQFGSDSLVSYEVGGKVSLLQNKVYLSSSLFYIDWSDIQTTVRTPLGYAYRGNAGKAVSQGVELEAEIRDLVLPGLTFNFGYSYTDAQLKQTIVGIGFDGEHMPQVPRHSFSAMADYSTRLNNDLKAGVSLLTTFTGHASMDFGPYKPVFGANNQPVADTSFDQQYLPLRSFWLTNLSLRLEGATWSARLFANNLFDTQYTTSRAYQEAYSQYRKSDIYYYANRPRTIGVEFIKRF